MADIKLLFGVLGGDSLTEGSGKEISDTLSRIVKKINDDPYKIKFTADPTSIENLSKSIRDAVTDATKNIAVGQAITIDPSITVNSSKAKIKAQGSIENINAGEVKVELEGLLAVLGRIEKALVRISNVFPEDGIRLVNEDGTDTDAITYLVSQLKTISDLVDEINRKEFNISNQFDFKTDGIGELAERTALAQNKAKALRDYLIELVRETDRLNERAPRSFVQARAAENPNEYLSRITALSANDYYKKGSSAKSFGELSGTIFDLESDIKYLYDLLKRVEALGIRVHYPDSSAVDKATSDLSTLETDAREARTAVADVARAAAESTRIEPIDVDFINDESIKTTCDNIEAELSALRERIVSTFDLSSVSFDASKILETIDEIKRRFSEARLNVDVTTNTITAKPIANNALLPGSQDYATALKEVRSALTQIAELQGLMNEADAPYADEKAALEGYKHTIIDLETALRSGQVSLESFYEKIGAPRTQIDVLRSQVSAVAKAEKTAAKNAKKEAERESKEAEASLSRMDLLLKRSEDLSKRILSQQNSGVISSGVRIESFDMDQFGIDDDVFEDLTDDLDLTKLSDLYTYLDRAREGFRDNTISAEQFEAILDRVSRGVSTYSRQLAAASKISLNPKSIIVEGTEEYDIAIQQLNRLDTACDELDRNQIKLLPDNFQGQINKLRGDLSKGELSVESFTDRYSELLRILNTPISTADKYSLMAKAESAMASAQTKLNSQDPGLTFEDGYDSKSLQGAISEVKELTTSFNNGEISALELVEAMSKLRYETSRYSNAVANASNAEKEMEADAKQRASSLKRVQAAIDANVAAQKRFSAAAHGETAGDYTNLQQLEIKLRDIKARLDSGTGSAERLNQELDELLRSQRESISVITTSGQNRLSFIDKMTKGLDKYASWFTLSSVFMEAWQIMRRLITVAIELDTAMTELKKVTEETDATYREFLDNASVRAKKVGASLVDVVSATADFARLGNTIAESEQLADAAIVYKNVGDGISDISQATESMIATMQAFGMNASEAMLLVDKFNSVGKILPNGTVMCRKLVAISVKDQRWFRPRKDLMFIRLYMAEKSGKYKKNRFTRATFWKVSCPRNGLWRIPWRKEKNSLCMYV